MYVICQRATADRPPLFPDRTFQNANNQPWEASRKRTRAPKGRLGAATVSIREGSPQEGPR